MVACPLPLTDQIRVLLVDDDESIRSFFKILLMTKKMITLDSKTQVEFTIKNFDPHVIILDYVLQDGDALEILTNIKPYTKKCIPIILTAMRLSDPVKTQLYMNGAMNILQKPCCVSTIESVIENYYEVSLKYRS